MAWSAGALLLLGQARGQAAGCAAPKEALDAASWQELKPVPVGTVVMFSTPSGWQGLDRIYPSRIAVEHRWRGYLPWGVPSVTESFSGKPALESIPNERPVLFVRASELESDLPPMTEAAVRLSRLKTSKEGRSLALSKGWTSFTQGWLYASKEDVPVAVARLSKTTLSLEPVQPLRDGEYLVTIGQDGQAKYEFSVGCGRGR